MRQKDAGETEEEGLQNSGQASTRGESLFTGQHDMRAMMPPSDGKLSTPPPPMVELTSVATGTEHQQIIVLTSLRQ